MHAISTIRGIERREAGEGYLVCRSTADIRDIMYSVSTIPELPPEMRAQKCLHADFVRLPGSPEDTRAQTKEGFRAEVTNLVLQKGPVRIASIGRDEDRVMLVVLKDERKDKRYA